MVWRRISCFAILFFLPGCAVTSRPVNRTQCGTSTRVAGDRDDVYRKNRCGVFLADQLIEGADPASFVVIDAEYAKDARSVFFGHRRMRMLDPQTFHVLDHGYSTDKTNVYYGYYAGSRLVGADAKSFRVFDLAITKDKDHVYQYDLTRIEVLTQVDAATFEPCPPASACGRSYRDARAYYGVDGTRLKSR